MDSLHFNQHANAQIERPRGLLDLFNPRGSYVVEHIRDNKLFDKYKFKNDIVTVGKNSVLDVYFRNQTQISAWYFGVVDNSGFTAFAAADTMSSHTGWTEFTTYSESVRQTWSPGAAASGSITNGTAATFTITGTGTLKGIFVTSVNTKSGTTGTLWSTAAFTSTVAVVNTDLLKITYTLAC